MGQNPSSNHFRRYKLQDAAKDGRLVMYKCTSCRRTIWYLASDLITVVSGDYEVHVPVFPCSRCKTRDHIFIELRLPVPGDYGSLVVRRPGTVRKTQTWRNVKLGD